MGKHKKNKGTKPVKVAKAKPVKVVEHNAYDNSFEMKHSDFPEFLKANFEEAGEKINS
jgi:hypothetical protein